MHLQVQSIACSEFAFFFFSTLNYATNRRAVFLRRDTGLLHELNTKVSVKSVTEGSCLVPQFTKAFCKYHLTVELFTL